MTTVCGAMHGELSCSLEPHPPGGHQAANGTVWFDAGVDVPLLEFSGSSLNAVGRKDGASLSCACRDPSVSKLRNGEHFLDAAGVDHSPTSCARLQGRKDDAGKLPYDLLPWGAVAHVVAVLQYGAKKYAPDNWKQVKDWRRRYFSAACRHLISWVTGEKLDPETGLHHLAHATCCVLFMLDLDK